MIMRVSMPAVFASRTLFDRRVRIETLLPTDPLNCWSGRTLFDRRVRIETRFRSASTSTRRVAPCLIAG